jgi:hypothetical protein
VTARRSPHGTVRDRGARSAVLLDPVGALRGVEARSTRASRSRSTTTRITPGTSSGCRRRRKASLDYFQANFSPYQFRQLRFLEFPAYADFAQAFANTMPWSENLGFIADYRDKSKIDLVTYVGAHEIGHQWWAHQIVGADQQGATCCRRRSPSTPR